MFSILAVISLLAWVGVIWFKGFTLYSFALILPTILFLVRKFGYFVKLKNILICEGMFLFLSITWTFIFGEMYAKTYLITILFRILFILVVLYDDKVYVYVTEERKKKISYAREEKR